MTAEHAEPIRAWRYGLLLAPCATMAGLGLAGVTSPAAVVTGAAVIGACGVAALVVGRSAQRPGQGSASGREPDGASVSDAAPALGRDELRRVLEGVPSPVFALDRAGVVLAHNPSAREFFSDRPGPLVGMALEDLFTQAEVLGQHSAALAGTARAGQIRVTTREGVRTFQVLTAPAPPGANAQSGVAAVLTLRDVTELATAVQLKTDFVANASHELRTPLSSIRVAVETLADGAWDDHAMRERLAQMIGQNVERLEDMVRDLLDLSRLESPEAPVQSEPVDTEEVFDHLREMFAGEAAERSLELDFTFDVQVAQLQTDPKLIHLILKNLLENAVKFAYAGTTVRLVGSLVPGPPGRRAGARFRVIDRGIGIPMANQHRVFERFYQVDPARSGGSPRRGTGLGLAIVKHAVKVLGGTIGVESVWKEGTTMTVELPGVVEPAPGPGAPAPASAQRDA
ncbi:MAG: ATP-binding protein [Planctomycetota bacterium]|nr:ATP-binding protein [Planctomycetota bacterium]